MQRSKGGGIIGTYPPDLWPSEGHPKPALYARMWARVLAALHESRKDEAARVIRRHRELIDNFQAIELPGPKDSFKGGFKADV
ncbi:MAG: hypothetical protein ABJA75_09005 [Bradyrhizobium sp.]